MAKLAHKSVKPDFKLNLAKKNQGPSKKYDSVCHLKFCLEIFYLTLAIINDISTSAIMLLCSMVVIGVLSARSVDFSNMFYIQTEEDRAEIKSD